MNLKDLYKRFDIHTDANKFQLIEVISQDVKPITFYSRKLTKLQQRQTVTKK